MIRDYALKSEHPGTSQSIIHLIYPEICPICKENNPDHVTMICRQCTAQISFFDPPYCPGCGGGLDNDQDFCGECLNTPRPWRYGYSAVRFRDTGRQLIHRFKYRGDVALTRLLAGLVYRRWTEDSGDDGLRYVVPVPLHWCKRIRRGYNQSELIAREFSKLADVPFANALVRKKWTRSQASLKLKQRRRNLRKAFGINKKVDLGNANILLMDDVLTTGATLAACTKVLLGAGAASVDVITIARG